jgi:hypothetical protein
MQYGGNLIIKYNNFSEIAGCAPQVTNGLIWVGVEINIFDPMKNKMTRARHLM